jgi:hypothetical protein
LRGKSKKRCLTTKIHNHQLSDYVYVISVNKYLCQKINRTVASHESSLPLANYFIFVLDFVIANFISFAISDSCQKQELESETNTKRHASSRKIYLLRSIDGENSSV